MKICGHTVKLLVYDFDGVMTDNKALLFSNGDEAVFINRSDGLAIEKIKSLGISQIIISTETNSIVLKRAKKLGIDVINGVKNKLDELNKYMPFSMGSNFLHGFVKCVKKNGYNQKQMIEQCKKFPHHIHDCHNPSDFMIMLNKLYNHCVIDEEQTYLA